MSSLAQYLIHHHPCIITRVHDTPFHPSLVPTPPHTLSLHPNKDRPGFVQVFNNADDFEQKLHASRVLAVSQRDDAVRSMVSQSVSQSVINTHNITTPLRPRDLILICLLYPFIPPPRPSPRRFIHISYPFRPPPLSSSPQVAHADEIHKHLSERKSKRTASEKNQSYLASISGKSDVSDLNTSTRGLPKDNHNANANLNAIAIASASGTTGSGAFLRHHHTSERFDPMLSKYEGIHEEHKTTVTTPPSNHHHSRYDASPTVAGTVAPDRPDPTALRPSLARTTARDDAASTSPGPVSAGRTILAS